ncbi:SDR family NAD(P)-dependent oxidoreductase [Sphingomonas nostoxanthinifaciens]|uniref:SDR family NAD(P)-dependent oxidoreductase n=1 Tax=Sphingomonas nostoxanthinifaciens TaxID=2872652 RepID=UPI001CC20BB2|nr:SDR family oxidoreductase [Sphingomonas nostoxanthinifaciens]UAK24683.1 SDR family oxidoreductase [Sphingomonas nostoxanthinifaciens]
MHDDITGTALITGASSGIGGVYADRLARRGHDLILVARDEARLASISDRLRSETGRTVELLRADLTDPADVARVERRFESDPSIGLLINNAGMSLNGGLTENGVADYERIIALNITATTRLAGAAAKAFVARGRGAIVNIASVLALAPERFDGIYSGTKAYMLNLSQSMSATLADKGVYTQAVMPGATRTEIWARSGKNIDTLLPPDWVMEVDDLVDAALLGFDRREIVTIPPLADEGQWNALLQSRLAMGPFLSRRDVAPRYRETVDA